MSVLFVQLENNLTETPLPVFKLGSDFKFATKSRPLYSKMLEKILVLSLVSFCHGRNNNITLKQRIRLDYQMGKEKIVRTIPFRGIPFKRIRLCATL